MPSGRTKRAKHHHHRSDRKHKKTHKRTDKHKKTHKPKKTHKSKPRKSSARRESKRERRERRRARRAEKEKESRARKDAKRRARHEKKERKQKHRHRRREPKAGIFWRDYGKLWRDYASVRELGRGAFGIVSLITNRHDGQLYALKQMSVKNPVAHQLADQEVQAYLAVASAPDCHRYIVCLHDYFMAPFSGSPGRVLSYCLLLQYVPGTTLTQWQHEWWARHRRTPPPAVFYPLLVSALDALAFVHERGVAHMDIKLDNMLIPAGKSYVILGDFGVSCFLSHKVRPPRVNCSKAVGDGTPDSLSPEHAEAALTGSSDFPSEWMAGNDVWAMGNAFLIIATGHNWSQDVLDRLPPGTSDEQVRLAMIAATPDRELPEVMYPLDKHINRALSKMMRKRPERRWTAQQALNYLQTYPPR
jgi:serine/threonine protein kinase